MRLAYSYIRFSSPEQKKGDSKRRQLEACEKFCKQHGLELESSRRFYDEGKSAYKGKHLTEGRLGSFLKLVESGRVPKGSVLIVEAMDRLSRQQTSTAFKLLLSILEAGVDVVTLADNQWFSQKTINENMGQLFMSVGALWSANRFSATLSDRVGKAWAQKRKRAVEDKLPLGKICPGWLKLSVDGKSYEVLPDRARIVRLIFWLALRGWGKQKIAKLFNRHLVRVPTWGVKEKQAVAWHYSYVQKVLTNRAVLGELIPYSTVGEEGEWQRRPAGPPIVGYYPAVVDEDTFLRAQMLRSSSKGPLLDRAANLFQGLLRDGDHPEHAMWYKDHGDAKGKWIYVFSDYRRVHPEAPMFSWPYARLELLLLRYLVDMDWSALTADRDREVRELKKSLEVAEARVAALTKQLKKLVELAKHAGDVEELAGELQAVRQQREEWRAKQSELKRSVAAKQDFSGEEAAVLIRKLATDRESPDSRKRLREAIRGQVDRIELFRQFPLRLLEGLKLQVPGLGLDLKSMLKGKCVRILFRNGVERWIVDEGDDRGRGVRFDGSQPPAPRMAIVEPDQMGGKHLVDFRTSERVLKSWEAWRLKRRAKDKRK